MERKDPLKENEMLYSNLHLLFAFAIPSEFYFSNHQPFLRVDIIPLWRLPKYFLWVMWRAHPDFCYVDSQSRWLSNWCGGCHFKKIKKYNELIYLNIYIWPFAINSWIWLFRQCWIFFWIFHTHWPYNILQQSWPILKGTERDKRWERGLKRSVK